MLGADQHCASSKYVTPPGRATEMKSQDRFPEASTLGQDAILSPVVVQVPQFPPVVPVPCDEFRTTATVCDDKKSIREHFVDSAKGQETSGSERLQGGKEIKVELQFGDLLWREFS